MRLLIPAVAILIISCSEKENPTLEYKTSSLQNSLAHIERHRDHSEMMIRAHYNENPEKYGEAYEDAKYLESLAVGFSSVIDSLLELDQHDYDGAELFANYDAIFDEIYKIRIRNHIDIENAETFKIGLRELEIDRELLLYLNQNINLLVSELMWNLSMHMDFGGGFRMPDISFKREESKRIQLSDQIIQTSGHRQIKLTEIVKDGTPLTMRPRIRNVNTFGEIEFDTLAPGAYSMKGDVHMLFGYGSFKVEPFEYEFVVE